MLAEFIFAGLVVGKLLSWNCVALLVSSGQPRVRLEQIFDSASVLKGLAAAGACMIPGLSAFCRWPRNHLCRQRHRCRVQRSSIPASAHGDQRLPIFAVMHDSNE